jgi:hypothetical protein
MGLNAIHRIRDMKKQISLILKKGIEMTQEKTGRECSQKKSLSSICNFPCIKIRDESGKGMR